LLLWYTGNNLPEFGSILYVPSRLFEKIGREQAFAAYTAPISKTYEIAGLLKQTEPEPVLFEHVKESNFKVIGNLFGSKALFASYFGITGLRDHPNPYESHQSSFPCQIVTSAPCQEVIQSEPDLDLCQF